MPNRSILLVTAVVALALSLRMKNAQLPLKYPLHPLHIVGVIQLVTWVYVWFSPDAFPYSIARHQRRADDHRLGSRAGYTALILGFFAVMIPHQVLAQAFILQHLSVLCMPVLYICMGAVLDGLVFVALYSWAVSSAPRDATV